MEDPESAQVRKAAFAWLKLQIARFGDTFSRETLEQGFDFQGARVRLVGPQGIFKPAPVKYFPLAITTTTKGPYQDSLDADGNFLQYNYRGTDP